MAAPKGNKYAKGNKGGGAKPIYNKEEHPKLAYNYCLLGATDENLADYFDVTEQTINNWKKKYKEFSLALKKGKELADVEIVESLYNRAKGVETTEDKLVGENVITLTKTHPPDTTAIIFWLKNRQPKHWRDKQEIDQNTTQKILVVDVSKDITKEE